MTKLQEDLAEIARIMRETPATLGPVPVYEPEFQRLAVGHTVHRATRQRRTRRLITLPRPES